MTWAGCSVLPSAPKPGGNLSPEFRRNRLRFDDFQLERSPDGKCRASVRLEWTRGRLFRGEAEGTQTLEGELRASATAALAAAKEAGGGKLTLELRGTKATRAFDSWIVVVSVKAWSVGESHQLMGAYPCPDENTPRGAVMAVLDATNRLMEKYLGD
jgi:hypothetical protein